MISHNSPSSLSYSYLIEVYSIAFMEGTIALLAYHEITDILAWLFVFKCRRSEKRLKWKQRPEHGRLTSLENSASFPRPFRRSLPCPMTRCYEDEDEWSGILQFISYTGWIQYSSHVSQLKPWKARHRFSITTISVSVCCLHAHKLTDSKTPILHTIS